MNEIPNSNRGSSLSDALLAELERATERNVESRIASVGDEEHDDFQRCYSLIESLALPVREALAASAPPPTLPDYYELQEIGRGGMGIVYRGRHKQTQRVDAIKVIRPDRVSTAADVHRRELQHQLRQEAQLAARVAHEHIVPVYQVGEVDGSPWFSMQFVEGNSLRDLVREGPLPAEEAVRIIEQIARAVGIVHRHGILHGDIKPHNILVEMENGRPLITDFGLADFIETTEVAIGIAGTPAYMAPELAKAALEQRSADEIAGVRSVASDIYSLGATLWSALTGMSPCEANLTPKEQLEAVASGRLRVNRQGSQIPNGLIDICRKCMMGEPDARYASASQPADELSRWLNRPQWNQFFPGLRKMLQMVVAPVLALGGGLVWWLMQAGASEILLWMVILSGYPPLFLVFSISQKNSRSADRARRELWSIWIGHLVGTIACIVVLRILCHPDTERVISIFYPVWAGISSVVFCAKSGNFWSAYRWIGGGWAVIAIVLSLCPGLSPLLFGASAAITCVLIARGDDAFQEN